VFVAVELFDPLEDTYPYVSAAFSGVVVEIRWPF